MDKEENGFINPPEPLDDETAKTAQQEKDGTDEEMKANENTEIEDLHEKFQRDVCLQMEKIYMQITRLQKLSHRKGADYTKEEVEKIFTYLEGCLAKCKDVYIQKITPEKFDFKF